MNRQNAGSPAESPELSINPDPVGQDLAAGLPALHKAPQPLRRSAFESVLTGVMGQGFLVVSGVLSARMLTVEDRGAVALATVVPLILVSLGTLGLPRAVTYEAARPGGSAESVLESVFPLAIAQAIGILGVGSVVAFLLSAGQQDIRPLLFLALVYVPFGMIQLYGLAALQGLRSFRAFNLLRFAPGASYAAVVAALFVVSPGKASLVVAAWILTTVATDAFLLARIRHEVRIERSLRHPSGPAPSRTSLTRFGARSLVGSLSPLGSMNADQVVVGVLLSPAVLGYYVVASSVCNLPRFVSQSLGLVAYPHVAGLVGRRQANAIVRLVVATSIITGLTVGALELTIGILIPILFGHAYAESVPIARVLLLSVFGFGISRVLSDCLQGAGRPLDGTISEVVAWLSLGAAVWAFNGSLDDVRFAAAMVLAAGGSFATVAALAFLRVIRPSRAVDTAISVAGAGE